jgi:hypothetical protein
MNDMEVRGMRMSYISLREIWTPLVVLQVRLYVDLEGRWYYRFRSGRLKRIRLRRRQIFA